MLARETAALGPEHALEHARSRAAAREVQAAQEAGGDRPEPPPGGQPPKDPLARADRLPDAGAAAAAPTDPAQVGSWTQAPFDLPLMAINAVVLTTGKVLLFSYPRRDFADVNHGAATLRDPAKGTGVDAFTDVPPPIDPDTGHQRHVELTVVGDTGGSLSLQAPPDANATPPGPYMLFLLDAEGVPSVARFVGVGPA